jgi:hypothetical protein
MKVQFRFSNGTSTLILFPENERDKTCIGLFRDGGAAIKLGTQEGSAPDSLVVTAEIQARLDVDVKKASV